VLIVEERSGRTLSHDDTTGSASDDYSVRLHGMTVWEEHLHTLAAADQIADEARKLGFADVCVVDDSTGELVK